MGSKSRKVKISKVKHSNHVITKLKKQGKLKTQRHRKKKIINKQPQSRVNVDTQSNDDESIQGSDMLDMMEQEDIDYLLETVNTSSKKRKRNNEGKTVDESLETEYESKIELPKQKKKKHLLPIKTKEGIQPRSIDIEDAEDKQYEEINNKENNEHVDNLKDESNDDEEAEDESEEAKPILAADILLARHEDVQKKKVMIGSLCASLLENPEIKMNNFFTLFSLMDEKNKTGKENLLTIRKLCIVSILEVFKDILPEYQINQKDFGDVKLKKVTLALNKYETALLQHYKRYLQRLEKMASLLIKKKGDTRKLDVSKLKLGNIAITCLCDLLVSHPYFNYSSNLAQMLVPFLNNRDTSVRTTVQECFKTIFKNDKRGIISLTIVRRINHLVKSRSNDVHCEVLSCLLALRIKDVNLEDEKKLELKQKKQMSHKHRLLNMSKKERKRNKKLKELEKDMLETKAEENKQDKQQNLTEITKTVFMIYFRILKQYPNSKLLSVTLEGLSKFAHVMNIEYFSDLVNVINGLLESEELGYRERLHCVETVFAVLSGQGDVLNIDPTRFYSHLYKELLTINTGKNQEDLIIIIRTLVNVLIKRRKKVSLQVLLAFLKRLSILSLQVSHHGSLACLGIVRTVMQQSKATDILLELDQEVGSGRYDPYLMEPEYCNASTTAFYELALLQRHYHPTVRSLAINVANGVPVSGEGALSTEINRLTPEQYFEEYDSSKMAFKPSIPPPKKAKPKTKTGRHIYVHPNFEDYCKLMANKTLSGSFDFSEAIHNSNK